MTSIIRRQYDSLVTDLQKTFRNTRDGITHILGVACLILNALMFWKLLVALTGCESPVVVVLSGSMEPGYYRGDALSLYNPSTLYAGDVLVFQVDGRDIPIVHRILDLHENDKKELFILSKGDNNNVDDRGLYEPDKYWLENKHILGLSVGYLPNVGILTIWINECVVLKWAVVSLMVLLIIMGYE